MPDRWFESHKIWAAGLVVGEVCDTPSHWQQARTLSQWLAEQDVPGIYGLDTRELTKKIRDRGTVLGKIVMGAVALPSPKASFSFADPNTRNLVSEVSIKVGFQQDKILITVPLKLFLLFRS